MMQSGTVTATIYEAVCRHHDGTNYVLYRVAENRDDAERIAAKIYNYEIDENGFRQVTRSLHPYVAAVYGWKTLQDNLVQVK